MFLHIRNWQSLDPRWLWNAMPEHEGVASETPVNLTLVAARATSIPMRCTNKALPKTASKTLQCSGGSLNSPVKQLAMLLQNLTGGPRQTACLASSCWAIKSWHCLQKPRVPVLLSFKWFLPCQPCRAHPQKWRKQLPWAWEMPIGRSQAELRLPTRRRLHPQ